MSDIIDINVAQTIEEVTINVTEEVIQVNINQVNGGGGIESVVAGTNITVDNTDPSNPIINANADAVTSVNSDTGAVIVDLQSAVEQGRTFTESDGTTQYDFETFTGSGTGKRFIARVTTLATSLVNIFSFGRNYLQAKLQTSATASKEFLMDLTNCYWENLNSSGYNRLRIPTRSVSGNSIFDLPNNRIRSSYNLAIEKERVISSTRTAENYTEYVVDKQTAGACVFTDPSTSQVGYTVFVFKGSAELGGVEFFEGSYIQRYYDSVSATWINTDLKTTIDATPTDGSSNAVSSNGVFDAVFTTATTGAVISFATPQIYNSIASPSTSNITDDLTGAKIGIVQKIYHNHSVAPTFPAGWVKRGDGEYVVSVLNTIYAEWSVGTTVEYWIVQ